MTNITNTKRVPGSHRIIILSKDKPTIIGKSSTHRVKQTPVRFPVHLKRRAAK